MALLLRMAASVPAQGTDLKGNDATKTGLITPALESGIELQIVTTDTVLSRTCAALSGTEAQFPIMVLPTSGTLGGRILADGAIRGMKPLRHAVIEAGANAVAGPRCNRAGMHWTVKGSNAILALRYCHLSSRFKDFWERRSSSN